MSLAFPFTAIVGQDDMKRALLLAAVEPALGGVLILGDRGTGKSTAVRALAAILPKIEVIAGCPYNCEPARAGSGAAKPCPAGCSPSHDVATVGVPVVDMPLGATEDRVTGSLDIERALVRGEKKFEPGLLARANRGFLYIDEINLLEDHLIDLLLDVAATGENIVEREGISIRHPARFLLVGSGNPEEGELRPQLLDRFGLSVRVATPKDVPQRVEVIRRRNAFERDPVAFVEAWRGQERELQDRLTLARSRIGDVEVPDAALEGAAELCLALGTDGLRGELTLIRAARALAAIKGRSAVDLAAIQTVAPSALVHRLRRDPLEEAGSEVRLQRAVNKLFNAKEAAA